VLHNRKESPRYGADFPKEPVDGERIPDVQAITVHTMSGTSHAGGVVSGNPPVGGRLAAPGHAVCVCSSAGRRAETDAPLLRREKAAPFFVQQHAIV